MRVRESDEEGEDNVWVEAIALTLRTVKRKRKQASVRNVDVMKQNIVMCSWKITTFAFVRFNARTRAA